MHDDDASGAHRELAPGALSRLLQELADAPLPPAEPGLAPGTVIGRFELVRELGRGGFGLVWEARDRELGRTVAFKLVRAGRGEAGADQVHREAEAVARLQHPNLVTLYDVGRCEHGPYLVLELLRGETLQARLARGALTLEAVLAIAVEVARGLAHAHAEGVAHRDLKPSNVFLCGRGGVKLLDFGMAHAFGHRRVSGGTPAYMAPEQWREAPEDERTDVFALGVMLYEMLTGALPFPDDGGRSVLGPEPAPRLEVPGAPTLGPLVAKMLAKDPASRTRDGGAALAELERIAVELPRDAPAAPVVALRPRSRWRRPVVATLAAAIALGAAAALLMRRAPAPSGPPSVAVLPFADMSERHDQEYFADGVAEEILNALARLDGLKVIGRTSSFSFKGRNEDLRVIGQKLDVANVLEGSLRRDGDQIRVNAQLIRVADGSHLWSETYDRKLSGIFKVQDEIARAVVAALEVKLLSGAPATPPSSRTTSPEAYRLYLLGRQAVSRDTQAALDESVQALERAVQLDPAYAPAQAWLGYGIYVRANLSVGPQLAAAYMALAKAERAIALAPDLADGYVVRGILRTSTTWEWAGARSDFDRALTLAPGDVTAQTNQARLLATLGRLSEALRIAQRALKADPLAVGTFRTVGDLQAASGDALAAEATFRRGLELAPGHARLVRGLGFALLQQGRNQEALALFEGHPLGWMRHLGLALAHHRLGHDAESRRALEALVAEGGVSFAYQIAEAYAWRGESDPAFAWLERAAAQSDAGLAYIRYDPLLHGLRSDPRFAGMLRKMNLPPD